METVLLAGARVAWLEITIVENHSLFAQEHLAFEEQQLFVKLEYRFREHSKRNHFPAHSLMIRL